MSTVATAVPVCVPTYKDMAPIAHWPPMFFWASHVTGLTSNEPHLLGLARERLLEMEVTNGRGGMVAKPS
jgi:hypothetical protein